MNNHTALVRIQREVETQDKYGRIRMEWVETYFGPGTLTYAPDRARTHFIFEEEEKVEGEGMGRSHMLDRKDCRAIVWDRKGNRYHGMKPCASLYRGRLDVRRRKVLASLLGMDLDEFNEEIGGVR